MKTICKDMLAALFMGLFLPSLLLNAAVALLPEPEPLPEMRLEAVPAWTEGESFDFSETIHVLQPDGALEDVPLEEHLVSVVLGEMPADFEPEALKAQAVAARTYTKKVCASGFKHGENTVCADAACCQAGISPESYLARGGTQEGLDKIRRAVAETAGEVLTYEGELIEAVYFSCSGGYTEDAAAVWGAELPYLQAVPSPGEENAAHDTDTVFFTPEEFQIRLGQSLTGPPESWFGPVSRTAGGGVDTMTIGGIAYTGTALRSQLDLRSTAFTVAADSRGVTVTTHGYGHRVGMSQYGADAMAATGSTYREILGHYYPGTAVEKKAG